MSKGKEAEKLEGVPVCDKCGEKLELVGAYPIFGSPQVVYKWKCRKCGARAVTVQ